MSRQIVSHDDVQNNTRDREFDRSLAFTLRADPAIREEATVAVAGTSVAGESALALAKGLALKGPELEKRARARYAGLQLLEIETPDEALNRALRWAQITLEQAWVCNPELGCGEVAGYGPSRSARRPQYDWFFAGDGLIAVDALLHEGAYARAREELAFILRYQDKGTGMIWHELSQSSGFVDWSQFPYMFVHVDTSFDFLNTVLAYAETTGDLPFVNEHWTGIAAAYEYCRSTLSADDGLPRIPAGKEGGDEQDPLGDELTLSLNWVKAAASFSALAQMTHHGQLADEARASSEQARRSIEPRYRDAERRVWLSGHLRSGAPVEGLTNSEVSLLHLGLLNQQETAVVLDRLSSPAYLTAWGIRSAADNAAGYDPESYARGSVWALGTASAAMALWQARRPETAFTVWHALVAWFALDAPGHMHEVLAGDAFIPERESVPDQTWSCAAFLSSAIGGLLGMEVNGREERIRFAPHLPATWNSLSIRQLTVGNAKVSLRLKRSAATLDLSIEHSGPALRFTFAPELPSGLHLRNSTVNGKAAHVSSQDAGKEIEVRLPEGAHTLSDIVLRFSS